MPMTSPVDFISGPSTVSTPWKRPNGQDRLLDRGRRVGRQRATVTAGAGAHPPARSSAMVAPSMTRAAALASGTDVALDTNGTVREARGLASST